MKRLLLSLGFLLVVFTLCFTAATGASAETNDDGLFDGLAEGETVVDFYTETIPADQIFNVLVPYKDGGEFVDNPDQDYEITPFERRLRWYAVSKSYIGHSYSNWMYAGASTKSGGVLSASHTETVANTYSGSLTVTKSALTGYVGFDIGNSWSQTVSYSSPSYPSGNYRLQYRHVYQTYRVKQERKYDRRGKTYETKFVYPKRWVERQYRVVKF